MFRDWRVDLPDLGERCYEVDKKLFKFQRHVSREKAEIELFVKEHYGIWKRMFDFFRAMGGQLYSLGKPEFRMLAREMKLTDLTKKKYTSDAKTQVMDEHDLDLLLLATKTLMHGGDYDIGEARKKLSDQEAKEQLFRYEFPEMLLRIAEFRYKTRFL